MIEIGCSLTSNLDHESLLREIVDAAREITGARYAALGVLNDARTELDQFVTVGIDDHQRQQIGKLPRGRGVLGVLIDNPQPLRLARVSDHPASFGFPAHHPPMDSFLGVPIVIAGEAWGNLYLTDKNTGEFTEDDEAAAMTLAAWASIAIQNARSVREDRLRAAVQGAEQERKRWARELHDETLQSLAALNVGLSAGLRQSDEGLREVVRESLANIQIEIANLRALISELRPAALDELGLHAALESLMVRTGAVADTQLELDFELGSGAKLSEELEVAIYRLVQESINNAVKHSAAPHIWVRVERNNGEVEVSVRDDGSGFDPNAVSGGFGLVGMRERVALVNGEFDVMAAPGTGTTVTASLPLTG